MPRVRPARVRVDLIEKGDGLPRSLVRLARRDANEYEGAVAKVVPAVESALGPSVLAERVRGRGSIEWTRAEPWRVARRRFDRAVSALGARPDVTLVVTDIQDCYGSIAQIAVERSLLEVGCDRLDVAAVLRFLDRCEAAGVRGLPIGPTASAVVANAVLAAVDRSVEARGLHHVRWVDDTVIAAADARSARAALDDLRAGIDTLGLHLHEAKTRIGVPASSFASCISPGGAR